MFGVVICSVYIHETVIVTCGYKWLGFSNLIIDSNPMSSY
jgi:hypothetical protein